MQLKKKNNPNTHPPIYTDIQQNNKQLEFTQKIKQNDQHKILCIKLHMLRDGLVAQRNKKSQLETQLKKNQETVIKCEEQNRRKQKKSESLTAEIKKLKDELIEQRNLKSKIYEELGSKMQQLGKTTEEKKTSLGLFGFRSLFSKDSKIAM